MKVLNDLRHIPLHGLRFRLVDAQGQVSEVYEVDATANEDSLDMPSPHAKIVGHLASQIAQLLQGKDKPIFTPKKNLGDVVVVINAAHVHFTHDTWTQKLYRWHTGVTDTMVDRQGFSCESSLGYWDHACILFSHMGRTTWRPQGAHRNKSVGSGADQDIEGCSEGHAAKEQDTGVQNGKAEGVPRVRTPFHGF